MNAGSKSGGRLGLVSARDPQRARSAGTDEVKVRLAKCANIQPLRAVAACRLSSLSGGMVEVESVDQERGSIHGKKKPPDRNPGEASQPVAARLGRKSVTLM